MPPPDSSEYAPYYGKYVSLVPDEDALAAMRSQLTETLALLRGVPEAEANKRHPPYTWSVKDVVGHLTDCERVFGYRALRFARGDATPLPGFEENDYARAAESDRRTLAELAAEFEALRRSHIGFFAGLPETAWSRKGTANNDEVTVRALAYILVGHERHHTAILRRRLSKA
jgi:hypothetical protein